MIFPAVFAVSLATLCYEVLLTRFFSFSQWNHLSFMVISIALLGYGASGSVLSLLERRRPGWSARVLASERFLMLILVCSLALSASFLTVKSIPLDYFRLSLEWRQGAYLFFTFALLLVPFFCAGAVMSVAFAGISEQSGWIYFASMLGSALGALLPAVLLPLLGEGRIVFCCALLLLVLPVLYRGKPLSRSSVPILPAAGLLFLLTCAALFFRGGALLDIQPSQYKLLPQVLQFPETLVVARSNTLRGRLDRLVSPYIRFAPGLSLKYAGELPPAAFLVQDGDALFVLYDLKDRRTVEFSRFLHSYAGYFLRNPGILDRVLILQQGGGLSLPAAVSAGAGEITLLVEHPQAAALYRSRNPPVADPAQLDVQVFSGNPRRHLARDRLRYDRIQLESWGPSVPGMASLDQEHLLTVEAFGSYLRHLQPDGLFILSRKLLLPPSDMLKVFSTAFAALEALGAEDPGRHILLIRGWDSYTLLCSPEPFGAVELAELRSFCLQRNFDPVFYERMEPAEANRFNSFPEPFHYREIQTLYRALQTGRQREYLTDYYLDIAPARDDRPFHSRFTRWLKLGVLFRSTGSRLYTLFLSGETAVLVVLCIAGVIGALLLLLPRVLFGPGALRSADGSGGGNRAAAVCYFLAAGAGFMFVEMAFLQSFTFVFGNPVIAFTVVLAELLVLSGIGGALSSRWTARLLPTVLAALAFYSVLLFFLLGGVNQLLLRAGGPGQILGSLILLTPIGLLMGVPFPLGLRILVSSPRLRAFGWAANGVASVLASILAVPLSMTLGISRLWLPAALCYALMLGALPRRVRT